MNPTIYHFATEPRYCPVCGRELEEYPKTIYGQPSTFVWQRCPTKPLFRDRHYNEPSPRRNKEVPVPVAFDPMTGERL